MMILVLPFYNVKQFISPCHQTAKLVLKYYKIRLEQCCSYTALYALNKTHCLI